MKIKLPNKLPDISTSILKYSEHPLLLESKVEELTVQQFVAKFPQPFQYSDELVLDDKTTPDQQEYKNVDMHYSIITKFFKCGFTDPSAFAVCNMAEVGHGLFADRDFGPCEVFILYSGRVVNKSKAQSDYSMEVNQKLETCIDASESGNLARFIQHMPFNYDRYLTESEYHPGSKLDRNDALFWEYRNLIYKENLQPSEIAWSNMSAFPLVIAKKVYLILYNTRALKRGDQLGLSYGIRYWSNRAKCPALFTLSGKIVPSRKYGFREIMISLPPVPVLDLGLTNLSYGYEGSYTKEHFLADTLNSEKILTMVRFHQFCDAVSLYDLRDLLLRFHVIEEEYLPLESDFVSKLRQIMPPEYRISLYSRNPADPSRSGILDLVFRTEDLMKWAQLTVFLKNPPLAELNISIRCLKATQEIHFLNVQAPSDQEIILVLLCLAKSKNLFTNPLKPEYIPQGPTRNDSRNLHIPSTPIFFSQIMRHNPGQTEQRIKRDIDEVMKLLSNPFNKDTLKSQKLSELTQGFFNRNPKIEWKVYPDSQLKGRYVGHNVRYYNLPDSEKNQADTLKSQLSKAGFDTELIAHGNNKSLVVDLSTSNPKF